MKDQIPQFLQEKLNQPKANTNKFPDEIKSFLNDYQKFYKWNLENNYTLIFRLMKRNVTTLPICILDTCNKPVHINTRGVLLKGCCRNHTTIASTREKYGIDHLTQSNTTKNKSKETKLKKYGNENYNAGGLPLKLKENETAEDFLINALSKKSPQIELFPESVKDLLRNFNNNISLAQSFFMLKYDIMVNPTCQYNDCENEVEFISVTKGFKKCCCYQHNKGLTMMQKYGVEHAAQSDTFKDKMVKSTFEKYGVKYFFQTEIFKKNLKLLTQEKYGVDHVSQSPLIIKKKKETLMKNYGVESPMHSEIIRNHHKNVMFGKYGVSNLFSNPEFVKKKFEEKYGVSNPMHVPEFLEKQQESSFKRKEYIWKTGEISLVQGYEPIVLKELEEKGYKFDEILTSPKDMPEIFYQFKGSKHRYYPDIFIPKENIVIEVKSNYTLKKEWDKNQAKFEATKSQGYDFKLEVR